MCTFGSIFTHSFFAVRNVSRHVIGRVARQNINYTHNCCGLDVSWVWYVVLVVSATVCLFTSHRHLESISDAFAPGDSHTHIRTDTHMLFLCLFLSRTYFILTTQPTRSSDRQPTITAACCRNLVLNKIVHKCEMSVSDVITSYCIKVAAYLLDILNNIPDILNQFLFLTCKEKR